MPQNLFSSSRAMGGIYRAIVVEPITEDQTRIGATVYIPALHRQQMPFNIEGDTPQLLEVNEETGEFVTNNGIAANGAKLVMRKQDYPFAPSAGWWARPQMQTGDSVFVVFENGDSGYPIIVGRLGSQLPLQIMGEGSFANGTVGIGEYVDIPEQYGTVETYEKEILEGGENSPTHGWSSSSKQGELRKDAISSGKIKRGSIFGLQNCAIIDNRLLIATKPNIGGSFPVGIGDYLDVSFSDGSVWNCILGDMKGADAPNPWGHDNGASVVEIIYWDYSYNSGNQRKKVTRITKVGNYWTGMISTGSPSASGFIWPAPTSTAYYANFPNYASRNNGGYHGGIDITVAKNQPIVAVADGVVKTSEYSKNSGFGNYIAILHGNGLVTRYCHLNKRNVGIGAVVKQGQTIGLAGNTSAKYSLSVHLHFEVHSKWPVKWKGTNLNPLKYVNPPKGNTKN